jgi:DNA-directed RNA polymerase alpha subunit
MNKRTVAAEELFKTAEEVGLTETLYGVFGKRVDIRIPFSKADCERSIDEIDFSIRAQNSLKRAGAFTVGAVVDLIADEELMKIRNLGKKTAVEIKVRIMEFGYSRLTEREKKEFFAEVVKRNCI